MPFPAKESAPHCLATSRQMGGSGARCEQKVVRLEGAIHGWSCPLVHGGRQCGWPFSKPLTACFCVFLHLLGCRAGKPDAEAKRFMRRMHTDDICEERKCTNIDPNGNLGARSAVIDVQLDKTAAALQCGTLLHKQEKCANRPETARYWAYPCRRTATPLACASCLSAYCQWQASQRHGIH